MGEQSNCKVPTPEEADSFPVIQLYSPDVWHGEAALLMNEAGRKKLIKALLQSRAPKLLVPAFVSDGEGYDLYIQVLTTDEIDKHKSPYTDEMCSGLDGEAEKKDPKYPVTAEEHNKLMRGKEAGDWKVII